jgi:hypothetical protein
VDISLAPTESPVSSTRYEGSNIAMKCVVCGSEAREGARFCADCGASLAPPVPASCIVFLVGDLFAPPATMLTSAERLPCGGATVRRRDLAHAMLRAAFAQLTRDGHIAFALGERRALIRPRRAVIVTPLRPDPSSGGLEASILGALTSDPRRDYAEAVVARAIGGPSIDPWGSAIQQAVRHLHRLGYYAEARGLLGRTTLTPLCDRVAPLRAQAPAVRALLQDLDTRDPALAAQLDEDIKRGVNDRREGLGADIDE